MPSLLRNVRRRRSIATIRFTIELAGVAMLLIVLSTSAMPGAHEPQGFVVLPNSAPRFSGPIGSEANVAEILATREQTGGTFGVWRYTSPAGGGPPVHIHRAEDEFFYVLSGEFNFQLGDCIKSAPTGSFVFIPKGAVHTFQHVGPDPGVLLGVVSPGGFEGLFMGRPGADMDQAMALMTEHHMDVVGPPLEAVLPRTRPTSTGAAKPPVKTARVGVLAPGCPPPSTALETFLQGLRDLGYVEGQNLEIDWRYAEGRAERFPELAAELAQRPVDLIVAVSTPAVLAAKQATQTIPVVMVYAADPVGTGLVASLARPGGNLTGVSDMATDLSAKRLELLKEAVPTLARLAVLWNAADPGMVLRFRELERAAQALGVTLHSREVRRPEEFERAFTAMTQERPDALFVVAEVLTLTHRCRIVDFATKHRLPTMSEFGVFAREGGLMAYGPPLTDTFQRGAYYVDKLLNGGKPAELPVEQPMNFELVLNPKTAEALGLSMPPSLLLQAVRAESGQDNQCARLW
jgi:putative tryptophan/tyrosine transport system substrate-binding protein